MNPFECNKTNHAMHWGCFHEWVTSQRSMWVRERVVCPVCRCQIQSAWLTEKHLTWKEGTRTIEGARLWVVPK